MQSVIEEGADDATCDTVELLRKSPARRCWVLEVGAPDGTCSRVLHEGDRVIIGTGKNADLRVADAAVSHLHCRVNVEKDRVDIEDLSSKNGLYVGPVRVNSAAIVGESGLVVIGRSSLLLRTEEDRAIPEADPIPGVCGGSPGMRRLAAEVRRHSRTRAPILLQGESGTGKDVVARAIHQLSRRSGGYVPLNVGALPEALADGELFGHRRGAFTGAVQSRTGAFEQAHGGTLFLDEIADLPLTVQVKLLRVVEDGTVRPLGATAPVQVDTRVVSASWADLEARVAEGKFRADLYHRLATVVIRIPPLRQRKSDLAELATVLLRRMRAEVGEKALSSAALSRLLAYEWPGNVRELGSVLYRAAMATTDGEIRAEHVALGCGSGAAQRTSALAPDQAGRLLEEHQGNVSAAARAARVPRSTFRSWLRAAAAAPQGSAHAPQDQKRPLTTTPWPSGDHHGVRKAWPRVEAAAESGSSLEVSTK